MPVISTPAIVLQAFPYSESSKILRLLTAEQGVCSVIAKGAQRPKSRFGGLLESFTEGQAQIFFKEGRDLHTLTGFDLVRSRQALGHDLTAFAGAALLAELVLRFGTQEPQPALFDLLSKALDRIVEVQADRLPETVIASVWLVVSMLGFRPETDACVTCGEALEPEATVRFDVASGGIACTGCRPHGRPVSAASRRELSGMADGDPLPGPFAEPALQRALVRAFLHSHLAREHAIRSLDLFLEQVG